MIKLSRLHALALALVIAAATFWAVDQRIDRTERSSAGITRQAEQLRHKAVQGAAEVQTGTRSAEAVAEELREGTTQLAEDAIAELDVEVPESAKADLAAAGIDVD